MAVNMQDTSFLCTLNMMDYSLLCGIDADSGELVVGIIDYIRMYTFDKSMETFGKTAIDLIRVGRRQVRQSDWSLCSR